ncbi:MAG: DUF3540 domain-containing protein [Planctomycetes bacterium]|nr:DUF3540 domain-containing protein [Planctomycetota bacterium]
MSDNIGIELGTLLTQARVLDVEGRALKLQAGERIIAANLALPYPYKPQVGDTVLVIAQGESAWVIGVIEGTGLTAFSAPANLELRATRGRIVLNARDEIEIKARDVNINADNASTFAKNLTQQVENLDTSVAGLALLRAREERTEIEQSSILRAENINQRARKEVKIDGEIINLG